MTLQEADIAQTGSPRDSESETKHATTNENDVSELKAQSGKPPRKFKLPRISIDFSQVKKKFASSGPASCKPLLYKLLITFVVTFICLTVYLSGSRLCKPAQSRKTSCLALGLCSNRNDPHSSIAYKIKSNVICPFHNVVDHVVSKTSAAITGSEDPFGAESMVSGIDLSALIF